MPDTWKKGLGVPTESTKVLTVRVSQIDADLVDRFAEREEIKRSDVLRWALAEFMDKRG